MAAAFSTMLPSSVRAYHTSTRGTSSPVWGRDSSTTGSCSTTVAKTVSPRAATRTTTTSPVLCQMPSRAARLLQLPPLRAAAVPVA